MPIYLCLMLVQAICFSMFFTVQLIYHVTVIGLSPLQMVLVGVVLEVVTFAFEIPTGVVADVFSRRRSILIGILLMGCSYTLEGAVALFWAALLSQVFWGIGYTFTSGANQAWITDEIGEDAVGPVFLRGRQMWLLGIVTGTLLAMLLGVLHIQLPMVLAGVGMLALSLALLLLMPERHMTPAPAEVRSTWGHMRATAQAGMRLSLARPVVRTVVLISLIVGLASEGFERLSTPQIIGRFTFPTLFGSDSPVLWFGLSGVVGALLGPAGIGAVSAQPARGCNAGEQRAGVGAAARGAGCDRCGGGGDLRAGWQSAAGLRHAVGALDGECDQCAGAGCLAEPAPRPRHACDGDFALRAGQLDRAGAGRAGAGLGRQPHDDWGGVARQRADPLPDRRALSAHGGSFAHASRLATGA